MIRIVDLEISINTLLSGNQVNNMEEYQKEIL